MNQYQYIAALKDALQGLSAEQIASICRDYEQRFIEGLAAGRSEAEIIKGLGDPKHAAIKQKAASHLHALTKNISVANIWRVMISLIGLAFVNLFMLVPTMVYLSMLMAAYIVAFACFVGGSAVTASGFAGVDIVHLDSHASNHFFRTHLNDDIKIVAAKDGIRITDNESKQEYTLSEQESELVQAGIGLGMTLFGVTLFLLSLLVTKYTLLAIKYYAQMNWNVLRRPA